MHPLERSGIPSEVIHPQERIHACVRFLRDAHERYAVPIFQRLQTVEQLSEFLGEYIRAGCSGRCRPLPDNAVYLWLLAAGTLGDDLDEIIALAKGIKSSYVGHDVDSSVQAVVKFMVANNFLKTQ
jgi:hypothetical protein